MIYSSGNKRRGTGRSKTRQQQAVEPVPYTEETAKTHLDHLQHQIEFAKMTGLNVQIYLDKVAEIVVQFPELGD